MQLLLHLINLRTNIDIPTAKLKPINSLPELLNLVLHGLSLLDIPLGHQLLLLLENLNLLILEDDQLLQVLDIAFEGSHRKDAASHLTGAFVDILAFW